MPYVRQDVRREFAETVARLHAAGIADEGELNYMLTQVVLTYLGRVNINLNYAKLNAAIGALECAKLELYRRKAAPYEDQKALANGDVY